MNRQAFTIPEVLVSSALVLILVGMASIGTVSFMRGYRKFTQESSSVRTELQTLDRLLKHLRSCQTVKKNFHTLNLADEPLVLSVQTPRGLVEEKISLKSGELWVEGASLERLGAARTVALTCSATGLIEIELNSRTAVVDWTEALP